MWKYDNREPTAETTTRTLLYLRAQIIREGLDGRDHVDALLRLRGCDPDAYRVPPKRRRHFRNGGLRRAVQAILREYGPISAREAGARLHERYQDMERSQAVASAKYGLCALKEAGMVVNEGRVWRLSAPI
jgi:hypothetical protein